MSGKLHLLQVKLKTGGIALEIHFKIVASDVFRLNSVFTALLTGEMVDSGVCQSKSLLGPDSELIISCWLYLLSMSA